MKSERGITITSLIVYIIGIVLVIAIMSVITTNFYKNVNNMTLEVNPIGEYTKFNSNFSEEVNTYNIRVLECKETTDQNYIVFDNGVQYTYVPQNEAIYKNKVKICRDVKSCTFTTSIVNGNDVVKVKLKIGEKEYEEKMYTLKK